MQGFVFRDFRETIDRAANSGVLNDSVRLVLAGRIEYAAERGDLSPAEGKELLRSLGPDFWNRYEAEIEAATFGDAKLPITA